MRGLTIMLAEAPSARLRTALTMALAHHVLGGRVRLFLDGAAVGALRLPIAAPDDGAQSAAGQPPLGELVSEALETGIEISLCQTGLHLAGVGCDAFDPRMTFGGMIGMLATLDDDRLIAM